jgi:hypothetical protein
MSEVSEMLQRIREPSEQSAVEIQKQDPEYSGLNYSHDPGYGAVPSLTSIDLSKIFNDTSANSNVQPYTWNTLSPSSVGGVTLSAGSGLNYQSPYTFSNTTGFSGKIELNGDNADITVNGQSLIESIKKIQERLNILTPNLKMEQEWDQLRELGEQYRALEIKLKEQGDMWAKLKAMPPPVID